MKSIILLFTLLSFSSIFSQSVIKSEAFDIIKFSSRIEILQLNNQNTFVIETTDKEGINVKIYNESRKLIKQGKLNLTLISDVGNFSSSIKALFEINKDVVFFYKRTDKAIHKLIRVILDPVNGNIKKEEEVSMLTGNEYENFFEIAKDTDSDYYAIFKINFKTGIEVLHFSPDHKVINKINYVNPNSEYKFFKPTNYFVRKDECVLIVSKVLNTDPINMAFVTINPKETLKYYVSRANKNDKVFTHHELSYTSDKTSFIGFKILYNNKFDLVHLFARKITGEKEEVYFSNITPSSPVISAPIIVDNSTLINYYKNELARKKEYNAVLRDLHTDVNGNILLLYRNISGAGECTTIRDLGILKLNKDGKISKSDIFPYHYDDCSSATDRFLYSSSPFFLSTAKYDYILVNNVKENMNLVDKKESYKIKSLEKTRAVKYTITDEKSTVEYIEPIPETEFDPFYYNISNYNENLKTYCSLVNDPKAKKSLLIWLKLD